MRYILILTFIVLSNIGKSQTINTDPQAQIDQINLRLDAFAHDYKSGYTIFLVGAAVTATGLMAQTVADDPGAVGYKMVMVGGGFISLAGLVKIGDATKRLRKPEAP